MDPIRQHFADHDYTGVAWAAVVFRFVIWLLAIAAVVFLVRMLLLRWRQAPPLPPRRPALDELELRFARGEISREEFFARRADLMGYVSPYPPAPPVMPAAPPEPGAVAPPPSEPPGPPAAS